MHLKCASKTAEANKHFVYRITLHIIVIRF